MLEKENLQQAINQYLDVFCVDEDMSKKTISSKRNIFKRMMTFLDGRPYTLENVLEFRTLMYGHWKTQEGHAYITRLLQALTNWFFRYEKIEENFAKKINRPKVSKRVKFDYVDPEIVIKIIRAGTEPTTFIFGKIGDNSKNTYIKSEMRLGLEFILETGLRINEALGLSGSDLVINDQTPSYWVLSKGNKNEEKDYMPIPKNMINELSKRIDRDRVFEMTEATCNKALERGCEKLGIKAKITCHTLRHIFATNLTKQGVVIQIISKLLRHRKIQTTIDYYQHLDVNDLSKIINNQQTVRAELNTVDWIENLERAIKNTGIEGAKNVIYSWERLENGGFSFTINPKSSI